MEARERILVALDVHDIGELAMHAKTLGPHVGGFKIGLEALLSIGLKPALNAMKGYGPATENIFVDAKIHDIPATMSAAVRAVVRHPQVRFVNVHASAGAKGMKAAADAIAQEAAISVADPTRRHGRAQLLAVTVLTSMTPKDAAPIYGTAAHSHDEADIQSIVLNFMHMAAGAGCDGIVCSPQEARFLSKNAASFGRPFSFVTPGVRPKWSAKDDQERVLTPAEAIQGGSTYLVIGRPILDAKKFGRTPVGAAQEIAEEIRQAAR